MALAIRRAAGIATSAGPGVAVIDYATPWQTEIWLDDEVIDWLARFDADEPVEPLTFNLDFDLAKHERRRGGRR